MMLTGLDQLWVADITYIRLETEFVYLAVILDAYSRRVIGWALDHTLEDELTLAALRMALGRRIPTPGLVHHSDRGIQYASQDYTGLLKDHQITISMSRKGNPYDNAACESFMKTLKYEEVHRQEYRDLPEARASIEHFLERVYKQKRLAPPHELRQRNTVPRNPRGTGSSGPPTYWLPFGFLDASGSPGSATYKYHGTNTIRHTSPAVCRMAQSAAGYHPSRGQRPDNYAAFAEENLVTFG